MGLMILKLKSELQLKRPKSPAQRYPNSTSTTSVLNEQYNTMQIRKLLLAQAVYPTA